ncbi:DegT/DnrJ/EryC1/StrS family aminotransferase [Actinokineospora guangxiensis]|uniref:DegT/DnrJ/EryC1/StrS family aminotransferase n=1 Tax=Actinokineospora guangxiensis TaxID=1490288 RepID=A0ABW0EL51_9PSEU
MQHSSAIAVAESTGLTLPFGRPCFDEREVEAVASAIRRGDLATGREVAAFEAEFAELAGFAHAVAVSSGSMANLLALAMLVERHHLVPGDRVVVAGCTFVSAVTPVVQLGLVPVFVDVRANGVNVDLDLVDRAVVQHGARAALLPHTLGQALPVDQLADLRARRDLALVEDCCESLGARHGDVLVGAVGDAATFSFYAGHHLTMGEGGVVACDDEAVAWLLRSLRSFGRDAGYAGRRFDYPVGDRAIAAEERYVHLRVGWNAKLTDLQAAFGRVQLRRASELAEQRRKLARALAEALREAPGWSVLGSPEDRGASPFAVALLVPPGRDLADVAATFAAHGIESRGMLGASLPDQPCFDQVPHIVHQPYARSVEYARRALLIGSPPGIDPVEAVTALRAALGALS